MCKGISNHVRLRNTRTKMYAARIACCPLVSHVEYAPRALLTLKKKTGQTDGRTDGRQTDALRGQQRNGTEVGKTHY